MKSATSSGLDATPALFRPTQRPLAAYRLRQAPTSIGGPPLLGHLCGRPGPAELSSAFADSRPVIFASRHPSVDIGHTTLLSFALSRCRPTASSVCTLPLALWVDKDPLAPGQAPTVCARLEERAFRLSAADFPRARISVPIVRLSTSRFSGPRGPSDEFSLIARRILRSACYPC